MPDSLREHAQGLLGLFALGDVAHGAGEVDAIGDLPHGERQLDGELVAILVQDRHFNRRVQGVAFAAFEDALHADPLLVAEALRHQRIDRFADDLRRLITEHPFGTGIPGDDESLAVRADDGVVRRLHDRLVALGTGAQGHLGLAPAGDFGQRHVQHR